MKRIIFIAIAIMAIFVSSCKKEEEPISAFLKFKEFVNNYKSSSIKDFKISFELNPYDYEGVEHNRVLAHLDSLKLINGSLSCLIKELNLMGITDSQRTPEYYEKMIRNVNNKIYDDNFNYKESCISSLNDFTVNEKEIVNAYFVRIKQIEDLFERIEFSKAAEKEVLNLELTNKEKQKILTIFAIYRYSTYYWNTNGKYVYAADSDVVDAIGYYVALNGEWDYGFIEDGKDSYAFAASFSVLWTNILSPTLC